MKIPPRDHTKPAQLPLFLQCYILPPGGVKRLREALVRFFGDSLQYIYTDHETNIDLRSELIVIWEEEG